MSLIKSGKFVIFSIVLLMSAFYDDDDIYETEFLIRYARSRTDVTGFNHALRIQAALYFHLLSRVRQCVTDTQWE